MYDYVCVYVCVCVCMCVCLCVSVCVSVCVCNIWIDVKLPSFFFPLLPFSNNAGGWRGHMRLHPTKLLI